MMNLNAKAVVSSRGQVVIPRQFRKAFGIHAGTELIFEMHEKGIFQVKPVKRSLEMFFGRCKRKNKSPLSISDMDKAISQAVITNDENTQ